MSAASADILAARDKLQASRESLLSLSGDALHRELEVVRRAWLTPGSSWMRSYLESACDGYRLSPEMLREHLGHLLSQLTPRALQQMLRYELGTCSPFSSIRSHPEAAVRHLWRSPALAVHFLASGTPSLAFESAFFTLLLRTPSLIRCSASLLPSLRIIKESFQALSPILSTAIHFATWAHEDTASVLDAAELVIVHGDDHSLRTLRSLTPVHARFVGYGHRTSVGVIDRFTEKAAFPALEPLCDQIAQDMCILDQRGCMSLQTLFIHEEAPVHVEQMLHILAHRSLPRLSERLPRGPLSDAEAADIMQLRGRTEFSGQAVTGKDFTLVLGPDTTYHGGIGGRTLHVVRYSNTDSLLRALAPLRNHLSTCALLSPDSRRDQLACRLAEAGVLRITRFGRMQRPLLLRTHDGLPRLSSWLLRVDVEHALPS